MANAQKHQPLFETLATTGTVNMNSRAKIKTLDMTGDVTLNAPANRLAGDEYLIVVDLNGNTLTLSADFVTPLATPPDITLLHFMLHCLVMTDRTVLYWTEFAGA